MEVLGFPGLIYRPVGTFATALYITQF